uniref:phosphorylase kinase n=1 Tax=Macrostomum lignano TaxID=282301 RepID=A0A1I8J2T3_9PLAT
MVTCRLSRLSVSLTLLLLILCGSSQHNCCYAFEFSTALTPFRWAWSGVKTAASGVKTAASGVKSAASGVKTVVSGAAGLTQSAYRLVRPTGSPASDGSSSPAEAQKSGHKPLGCFEDIPDKTSKLFQQGGSGRRMNKAKCSSKCAELDTELFGLRSSPTERGIVECWCGHSFTRLPSSSEFNCANRCPDEEAQAKEPCGGLGYVSVYERASPRMTVLGEDSSTGEPEQQQEQQQYYNKFNGQYEPKEILGRLISARIRLHSGLSSVVRRCQERATNNSFAVKIIDLNNLNTDRQEVIRELKILRTVQGHPSIIRLHDNFETEAYIFFVFEICPNGELFEHLNRVVRMSEKRTRAVLKQLLSALDFLHSRNIVHRDVKAENILLDSDMNIKLTDFGFAIVIDSDDMLTDLCGTPSYLSPEILVVNMFENRDIRGYGRPVDLWASGVLMYTMLSGSPPFWHRRQMTMLRMIMEARFSLDSPDWEESSDLAKDLIRLLLRPKPADRLTAAEALMHPFLSRNDCPARTSQQSSSAEAARVRFRSAVLAVRCLARLHRCCGTASQTPRRLPASRLRQDPYGVRGLRGLVDSTAFLVYGHWVKKAESQNRAALFETSLRKEETVLA